MQTMEDESVRTDGYSSLELMQHLDALMIHRSNVLNVRRDTAHALMCQHRDAGVPNDPDLLLFGFARS